jgi:serine phosphatase RsbU (regulator of sigma subunit)
VRISNAGHPPPLVISGGRHTEVRATGVPIGMFCESQFSSTRLTLGAGSTLLMYTDGLSDTQ